MSKSKAVIWDMDGVIVDTALYHLEAWQAAFQKRGVNFTEADFRHGFGQRNDSIIRGILGADVSSSQVDAISREKEESFRRSIVGRLRPLPGVTGLMTALKEQGFKMALASSAPIENIHLVIRTLNIGSCFEAIVCDKDVTEGKPSPQAFLLAAERLGVEPGKCVVIEDAITGVTAAKRAGMYCLAVTNTHPRRCLMEADLVVDVLEKVSAGDIERLFNHSDGNLKQG